jgi:LysM domain
MQVKRAWVPVLQADSNHALRMEIEGHDAHGSPWPGFDPAWVTAADEGEYRDYVDHVRRVIALIGAGGEEAMRAAYFQGHVELIGMRSGGGMRTAPLDLTDQVHVPNGIADRAALAVAANVPEPDIAHANPGLTGSAVHFGMAVTLPGCREHVIVQAEPTDDAPAGPSVIETPAQIADQHGVAEADVRRANPAVDWARLTPGDRILIPRH